LHSGGAGPVKEVEQMEAVEDIARVEATHSAEMPVETHKKHKKHKKVRSVWISFVGRILAQFVGSAATIVLGLLLLHKYQPGSSKGDAAGANNNAKPAPVVAVSPHTRVAENSIAVLPLRNLSRESSDQYLADSMTDVLKTTLAQIPGLVVVSASDTTFTEESRNAHAAPSVGARYVLEGSIVQADGRLRVTTRLVDVDRESHVWASHYERPAKDILKIEDEIATSVVREVTGIVLQGGEASAVPATCVADIKACSGLPVL
jgi:TolB-like protein